MKGKLKNTEKGWVVEYQELVGDEHHGHGVMVTHELPLHPINVIEFEEDTLRFDNFEARIKANPVVNFVMTSLDGIKYAKLVVIVPTII